MTEESFSDPQTDYTFDESINEFCCTFPASSAGSHIQCTDSHLRNGQWNRSGHEYTRETYLHVTFRDVQRCKTSVRETTRKSTTEYVARIVGYGSKIPEKKVSGELCGKGGILNRTQDAPGVPLSGGCYKGRHWRSRAERIYWWIGGD